MRSADPFVLREAAGGRPVQGRPLAGREICLDRRPYDRVDKAQRPTFLEDPGIGELIGKSAACYGVQFGQASRDPKRRPRPARRSRVPAPARP